MGILELSLANNDLCDKGAANICSALYQDVWLLSLDLRMNRMNPKGLLEVLSVLNSNRSILLIDSRENLDRVNNTISKKIVRKLRRNINEYRNRAGEKYNDKFERRLLELFGELSMEYISSESTFAMDVTVQEGSPPAVRRSRPRSRRRRTMSRSRMSH
jgi:hypothetical protein